MPPRTLLTCISVFVVLSAGAAEPKPKLKPALLLPTIVRPVEFTDGTLAGRVSRGEIGRMGQRELELGEGHSYEFVSLGDRELETRNLATYRRAMLGGGQVNSGYAVACAGHFAIGVSIWEFLKQAKPSRVTHFDKHWIGTLSVDLVYCYGSEEKKQRVADVKAGKNLVDYQKKGEIRQLKIEEKSATFEGYRSYRIEWLASGDLNGDGAEDRLILVHRWALEGTASSTDFYLVTRKSTKASCSVVKSYLEKNDLAH